MRRHHGALTDFLTSSIRQREDAEDLAQAALIKAYLHIGRYDGRAAFRTWLCAIGYRELLMLARRQRAHRRILDRVRGEPLPPPPPDPDWPIDMRAALDELPSVERRLVMLCDVAGLTHAEAAGLLDMPLGTLKSRIKRAKARLSARLSDSEGRPG